MGAEPYMMGEKVKAAFALQKADQIVPTSCP